MTPTAELYARTRGVALALGGLLALVLGTLQAPTTGALVAAFASAALACAVLAVALRVVTSPVEVVRHIGARSRKHREALDRTPEPAHPDTAGRTRSRAPGGAVPTA